MVLALGGIVALAVIYPKPPLRDIDLNLPITPIPSRIGREIADAVLASKFLIDFP